ncbi:hypothetical protein DL93DRAFT_2168928 [Clavulina sp. PMI_390]|nr:hypothetical protein DL93DRAFT_2168928 [Clavulina sp. PMI_390]
MKSAYRGVLRELSRSTPGGRAVKKGPALQFRRLIETCPAGQEAVTLTTLQDATTYLRTQREYNELLRRYNPLHDMSAEEHLNATVNRVGLQMPAEVDPSKSDS